MAPLAKHERLRHVGRIRVGLLGRGKRARNPGKPVGRSPTPPRVRAAIRGALAGGNSHPQNGSRVRCQARLYAENQARDGTRHKNRPAEIRVAALFRVRGPVLRHIPKAPAEEPGQCQSYP